MNKPLVKNLDKKLEKIEINHVSKLMDFRNISDYPEQYDKRIDNALRDVLPLRYLKRRNLFVNYKESCGFNPVTGEGHSYRWYSLSRVIKGHLVLNTYGYSSCTIKHVSKFRTLFNLLGLKYLEIQAPRGLQDLEATKAYQASLYADSEVKNKYARKPYKGHKKAQERLLKVAKTLGVCPSQKMLKEAVKTAEADRRYRLEKLKEKRNKAKLASSMASATVVENQWDKAEKELTINPFLHLVKD